MGNIVAVSIIMPVYNSEKYLEKCVNSILAQEFDDFELLLIDDGSTDSSPAAAARIFCVIVIPMTVPPLFTFTLYIM